MNRWLISNRFAFAVCVCFLFLFLCIQFLNVIFSSAWLWGLKLTLFFPQKCSIQLLFFFVLLNIDLSGCEQRFFSCFFFFFCYIEESKKKRFVDVCVYLCLAHFIAGRRVFASSFYSSYYCCCFSYRSLFFSLLSSVFSSHNMNLSGRGVEDHTYKTTCAYNRPHYIFNTIFFFFFGTPFIIVFLPRSDLCL